MIYTVQLSTVNQRLVISIAVILRACQAWLIRYAAKITACAFRSPFAWLSRQWTFSLFTSLYSGSELYVLSTLRISDVRVTRCPLRRNSYAQPRTRRKPTVHFLGLPVDAFPASNGRIEGGPWKRTGKSGGRRGRWRGRGGTEDRCVDRLRGESNVWTEGAQQCVCAPLTSWRSVWSSWPPVKVEIGSNVGGRQKIAPESRFLDRVRDRFSPSLRGCPLMPPVTVGRNCMRAQRRRHLRWGKDPSRPRKPRENANPPGWDLSIIHIVLIKWDGAQHEESNVFFFFFFCWSWRTVALFFDEAPCRLLSDLIYGRAKVLSSAAALNF